MNEELKIIITAVVNDAKKQIQAATKELESFKDTTEEVAQAQEEAQKEVKKTTQSFSKMKTGVAAAGKAIGSAVKTIGVAIVAAGASMVALTESTREYRTEQAKLATAFETAGGSAEQATQTYNDLYRVLGDSGQATEAANLLAQMTTDQEELSEWTRICQGAYATFGESLPVESLAEAANETAKTGEITGALADAINWAGMSEDEFADKLFLCNSEAEREELIRSTLNDLYGEAADGYEENAASILAANEAQAALTAGMAALGEAAEPIVTFFKNELAVVLQELTPHFQTVADGITDITNGIEGGSGKISEGIKGMVDTVLSTIISLIPGLLGIGLQVGIAVIEGIRTALPDIIAALGELFPQLVLAIEQLLPQVVDAVLNAIPLLLDLIGTTGAQILESLGVLIPEILAQIIAILPQIIQSLLDNVSVLLKAAISFFMAIVKAIPKILPPLIKALPQIIGSIYEFLLSNMPVILEGAVELLMGIIDAIPSIVIALAEAIPQIATMMISTLLKFTPTLLSTGFTLFMSIVKAIPSMIVELVKALPQIVSAVVNGLKNGLGSGASQIWSSITNVFSKAPTWFKDTFAKAGTAIKNAFSSITSFFSGIWNNIVSIFSKAGDKVGSAIKSTVSSAVNKVLSTAASIINGFIGAINSAISVINAIPGVNISKLSRLSVPKLARGGVVDTATLAMIGENGKEAVVPLENNTEWIDKLAERISDLVGSGSTTPIVLQIDGKTFAQLTVDQINNLTRQRGNLPLLIR